MTYGELTLNPIPITRNMVNGRFLKGNTPHNKGKKLSEYMSDDNIQKVMSGLRRTGRPDIWKDNAKQIVAIKDGKLCGVFSHSNDAMRKTGINARNIRSVCNKLRKTAGGYQWFFEESDEWIKLIK